MQSIYATLYPSITHLPDHGTYAIDVPPPVKLEGKYLIQPITDETTNGSCSLWGKIQQVWNKNIVGLPWGLKVSNLIHGGIDVATMGKLGYTVLCGYTGICTPTSLIADVPVAFVLLGSLGVHAVGVFRECRLPKPMKIKKYLEWLKNNPYFLEMWESINREKEITFKFISKKEVKEQKDYCSNAWYNPSEHAITLVDTRWELELLQALIFECCNAFQQQRILQFNQSLSTTIVDRNTFGILKEKCEYNTVQLYHEVVRYGVEQLKWHSSLFTFTDKKTKKLQEFEEILITVDKVQPNRNVSHIESYRLVWDQTYAPLFFLEHPEELKKHSSALLQYRSEQGFSLLHLILFSLSHNRMNETTVEALTRFVPLWLDLGGTLGSGKEENDFSVFALLYCFKLFSLESKSTLDMILKWEADKSVFDFAINLPMISYPLLLKVREFIKLMQLLPNSQTYIYSGFEFLLILIELELQKRKPVQSDPSDEIKIEIIN